MVVAQKLKKTNAELEQFVGDLTIKQTIYLLRRMERIGLILFSTECAIRDGHRIHKKCKMETCICGCHIDGSGN